MRVSSSLMVGRYLKQINNSYENQTKLMEQSDGSNLHRPSDDSVRYSRYLRYQNSNTENLQYQDNVKAGISWMKTADASMNNMTDIYTTLKEKTIDAANDTNGELDLMAIAKEFKAKLYEMVSLGNSQQGDRYLFSGQSDLTQPFVISVEDRDRGLAKTLDDPQAKFFTNPTDDTLNVSDKGSLKQMLTLNGSDGNTYYVNPMNGYIYTEDFIMNGYKDKVALGQTYAAEGDEVGKLTYFSSSDVKVSSYFMNTGELKQESSVTVTNSSTGTSTKSTYKFGDSLSLGPNETAVADVDVEITDASGNRRIVSAGDTVTLATGETAIVGPPLRATMNGTTEATVLKSSTGATIINSAGNVSSGTYVAGSTLPMNANDSAVVGMDVQVTDANGNTRTVSAGNPFTLGAGETARVVGPHLSMPANTGFTVIDKTNGTVQSSSTYIPGNSYTQTLSRDEIAVAGMDVDVTFGGTTLSFKAGDQIDITSLIPAPTPPSTTPIQSISVTVDVKTTQDASLTSSTSSYKDGDTLNLSVGDTTVVGMDVQLTDASGNTRIISAGTAFTMMTGDKAVVAGTKSVQTSTNVTLMGNSPLSTTSYNVGDTINMSAGDTATAGMAVEITDASGNVRTVPAGESFTLGTGETAVISAAQSDPLEFTFATVRQPIVTYQGDAKYISMVKLNGTVDQTADTVNTTGQDLNGSDIFDDANSGNQVQLMSNGTLCYVSSGTAMLNNMFTVCAKLEMGNNRWMSTDGITIADQAHETVVTAETKVAARQNVYDSVSTMLDKQNEGITSDINDVSATDVAELAVRLMEAQTIYNMSLSVGSRILPPTLADYL